MILRHRDPTQASINFIALSQSSWASTSRKMPYANSYVMKLRIKYITQKKVCSNVPITPEEPTLKGDD